MNVWSFSRDLYISEAGGTPGLAASALTVAPAHSSGVMPWAAAGVKTATVYGPSAPRNRRCGWEAFWGWTSIFIGGSPGMLILNLGDATSKAKPCAWQAR